LTKILTDINIFFSFLIVERLDYSGNIFVTQIKPSLNRFAFTKSFIAKIDKTELQPNRKV